MMDRTTLHTPSQPSKTTDRINRKLLSKNHQKRWIDPSFWRFSTSFVVASNRSFREFSTEVVTLYSIRRFWRFSASVCGCFDPSLLMVFDKGLWLIRSCFRWSLQRCSSHHFLVVFDKGLWLLRSVISYGCRWRL